MKSQVWTIAVCALLCFAIPADNGNGQSGFREVPAAPATIAASSVDSRFVVLDTSQHSPGVYVLQLDLGRESWAIKTLTAVTFDGAPVGPTPGGGGKPGPEPEPETPLGKVQSAFGDSATFEQQRKLMVDALDLPENMADVAAMSAWIQRGFDVAVGNDAEKWQPWLTWYHEGAAAAAESADDYRAWVALALESLE